MATTTISPFHLSECYNCLYLGAISTYTPLHNMRTCTCSEKSIIGTACTTYMGHQLKHLNIHRSKRSSSKRPSSPLWSNTSIHARSYLSLVTIHQSWQILHVGTWAVTTKIHRDPNHDVRYHSQPGTWETYFIKVHI